MDGDERLAGIPAGSVDATEFMVASIARDLRAARVHAGLSQVDLARKLKKSQTMVLSVEMGRTRAPERYVAAVLKACGLPKDWKGAR